jgi:hypothetical protein
MAAISKGNPRLRNMPVPSAPTPMNDEEAREIRPLKPSSKFKPNATIVNIMI